ncbi:MAG: PEGA domain-containing protein [Kiritimatiellae bacterium]|nr:PEGA domain-containing protein [Kiritimatiellia bacterium]
MKGKMLRGALLAVAALALTGAKPLPMRLDVTGRPEGAKVFVDGTLRGTLQESSACSVMQLAQGLHLLHVEAPFHWPLDAYVRLSESENFVTKAVDLKPVCGLLLVKTKPEGAAVTWNGSSLGTTPLLLSTLPCGVTHTLDLSLNGYRKTRVEVRMDDRTPLVREEELMLDSGQLLCATEPAGATVLVNGIERGVTPVEVLVPRGGATLTFRLKGYQDVEQSVGMSAGERRQLTVKMDGLPARLTVVTEPEKAKVYLDGNFQGKSPVTVEAVKSGAHEIRTELPGYAPSTRTVEIANGGDTTEKFTLESVLGRIEVSTEPVGAKVSLDDRVVGTTRAGEARILTIEDVEAGEHTVKVYLDGYLPQSRTVTVGAKETKQLPFTLKRDTTADTEVELIDGSRVSGLLKREDDEYVVLETKSGMDRPIPRANIRKVTSLKK